MGRGERARRGGEAVREVVARAIQTELSDPRLEFVTITSVEATADLREALVRYSTLDESAAEGAGQALESARPILQRAIAARLQTRNTPVLRFAFDDLSRRAEDLSRLIDEVAPPESGS